MYLLGMAVCFRLQNADVGEMTVVFGKIQSVSDDKGIGDLRADKVCLDGNGAAGGPIEQP